jgi:hypothetical protein
MDPINPLARVSPQITPAGLPVTNRVELASHERERSAQDRKGGKRREQQHPGQTEDPPEDDGHPHIDVRV